MSQASSPNSVTCQLNKLEMTPSSPVSLTVDDANRLRRTKSQSSRPAHKLGPPPNQPEGPPGRRPYYPSMSPLPPSFNVRPFFRSDAPSVFQHSSDPEIIQNCADDDILDKPYELFDAYAWVARAEESTRRPLLTKSKDRDMKPHPSSHGPDVQDPHAPSLQQSPPLQPPSGRFFYAITLADTAIGCISVSLEDDDGFRGEVTELMYWIGREYRGRGIVTTVVKAFVLWLWRTYPSLVRIDAGVYSTWNKASGRVLQKAGFEWESVQRRQIWQEGKQSDLDIWVIFREGEESSQRRDEKRDVGSGG